MSPRATSRCDGLANWGGVAEFDELFTSSEVTEEAEDPAPGASTVGELGPFPLDLVPTVAVLPVSSWAAAAPIAAERGYRAWATGRLGIP